MAENGLQAAIAKMQQAEIGSSAIESFTFYYRQLQDGKIGTIREEDIEPLTGVPALRDIEVDEAAAKDALAKTVIIKLNGGLGTSMGLDGPKSLLHVRDGLTFLDISVRQVLAARKQYDVKLPIIFMHSFATRKPCLDALSEYPELTVDGLPIDFEQSSEPKLDADDLSPVSWPADPSLEWCPPGHGDIYPSLRDSGVLDQLIEGGYRYAAVSNVDNLGARPDARLAGWFASSGAEFACEVCRRTSNDRKGGHLAVRRSDQHIILRESAQTREEDLQYFSDENRHAMFNSNNLWLDLAALRERLNERHGVLGLPLIKNTKTVDPTDPSSPKVVQIETAMGAAIEIFKKSAVVEIDRDRFVPVKKTNELLILRSDCYNLDDSYHLVANAKAPKVDLDPDYYQLIQDFDARFPKPLHLSRASALSVKGDVSFGENVEIIGDVKIEAPKPTKIPDKEVIEENR
ncbi:UTP--glucose-1-phosphate uridylyltransferase [Propionimicrobium lymphophilum]|uniref:UTP--glucose-1-phosphate uridylyltransferase n=1 Tax=Propionimicrobium lymphophilum TaxID=33012 RepID=UPI0023F5795D|nr:UTP--glucose-1-phosphate uridylyltransferase [Propionimicrobium lymphophilum]